MWTRRSDRPPSRLGALFAQPSRLLDTLRPQPGSLVGPAIAALLLATRNPPDIRPVGRDPRARACRLPVGARPRTAAGRRPTPRATRERRNGAPPQLARAGGVRLGDDPQPDPRHAAGPPGVAGGRGFRGRRRRRRRDELRHRPRRPDRRGRRDHGHPAPASRRLARGGTRPVGHRARRSRAGAGSAAGRHRSLDRGRREGDRRGRLGDAAPADHPVQPSARRVRDPRVGGHGVGRRRLRARRRRSSRCSARRAGSCSPASSRSWRWAWGFRRSGRPTTSHR